MPYQQQALLLWRSLRARRLLSRCPRLREGSWAALCKRRPAERSAHPL